MRNVGKQGLSWRRLIALSACGTTAVAAIVIATVGGSATAGASSDETARKVERSGDVALVGRPAATAGFAALPGSKVRRPPQALGYRAIGGTG